MVRIKHILCPIDFSEFSRHAFDRALAVARSHGASVTALHVFPAPAAVAPGVVPLGPEGPGPFALHHVDREQLTQQMVDWVSNDPSLAMPIDFRVVEGRSVFREILLQADKLPADLIVMGTHGHSGLDRLLVGSVTERVLNRASVPVLTVPALAPDVDPAVGAAFGRILCAVDFSDSSPANLDYAISLAEEGNAQLTVLHVVELQPVVYEPSMATPFDLERDRPRLEEAARSHLHRFVPESVRPDVVAVVTSGKPYVEILNMARARGTDLIVLGVRGHNAIDRLLFGSTANHVVRRATCPVLTVRRREDQ
jgi:nucleotide-binding universal stress UspA family protein